MKKTKKKPSEKEAFKWPEFIRHAVLKAKDGQDRYITLVMLTSMHGIRYGISIATKKHYKKELGVEIARNRAKSTRANVREKGLNDSFGVMNTHMEWLERNQKVLHKYADYFLEQVEYNINDIIWPK